MNEEKLAIVFPGQGSQFVGMNAGVEHLDLVKDRFQQASDHLNLDLWNLVSNGPQGDLNKTMNTQPALLAMSVSIFDVFKKYTDIVPAVLAGHSLGEYSALVCGGSLSYLDAIMLVSKRGKLMQEAVEETEGAMAAVVGLGETELSLICSRITKDMALPVECANLNTANQIVISGGLESVNLACERALSSGAKRAVKLDVSVPSHCSLMKSASEELSAILSDIQIKKPKIPVVHNVDGEYSSDVKEIKDKLSRQLFSPVFWQKSVTNIIRGGCELFVECGPNKVLTTMLKRIDKNCRGFSLASVDDINKFNEYLRK